VQNDGSEALKREIPSLLAKLLIGSKKLDAVFFPSAPLLRSWKESMMAKRARQQRKFSEMSFDPYQAASLVPARYARLLIPG
jgi:hypothetical protein